MVDRDLIHLGSQALDKTISLFLGVAGWYKALCLRIFTRVIFEAAVENCTCKESWQEDAEDWLEDYHEGLVETTKISQVVKNWVNNSFVPQFSLRALKHESETEFWFMIFLWIRWQLVILINAEEFYLFLVKLLIHAHPSVHEYANVRR